ncbi:MAG TPA: copper amine oxidase N-terminal domain-containing protein [Peptococcaceae bacterium]|nr:copper amine oxidase N-terminal domain-containing protein [Peptococcaceae bacterium]
MGKSRKKITASLLMVIMCLVLLAEGVVAADFHKKEKQHFLAGEKKRDAKITRDKQEPAQDVSKTQEPAGVQNAANNVHTEPATDAANQITNDHDGQAGELNWAEKIRVRGKLLDYDGAPPVNIDGRILIPLRAVMTGLDAQVDWDEVTRTVTVTRDDKVVVLDLNTGGATVNGTVIELDVPAQIINDRTYVPLRFVGESLGENVDYDYATGDINIGSVEGTPAVEEDGVPTNEGDLTAGENVSTEDPNDGDLASDNSVDGSDEEASDNAGEEESPAVDVESTP